MSRRGLLTVALLTLLTCGLYGLYWTWSTTRELRELSRRGDLSPGLDVLMLLLTFGLWAVWIGYRNASIAHGVLEARGARRTERSYAIALLAGLGFFAGIATLLAVVLLQEEYNQLAASASPGRAPRDDQPPSTTASGDPGAGRLSPPRGALGGWSPPEAPLPRVY